MTRTPEASSRGLLLRAAGLDRPVLLVDAPDVADAFLRVTSGWKIAPSGRSAPAPCVTVRGSPDGFAVDSEWVSEPCTDLSAAGAVCGMIVDMSIAWLAQRPELIGLHCGAVELGGRLVAIAGGNRSGKSTLVARLAMGVRVFCDDILPVDAERRGVGLGVAPRLRLPLPRGATPAFRAHVDEHLAIADARYGYVRTPGLAPHGTRAPLGVILLLDRKPQARARLDPATAWDAARILLLRNLTQDHDPEALLDRIVGLIGGAEVWWLTYADLESAVRLVEASFAEGAAPPPRRRSRASRRQDRAPAPPPQPAAVRDVRYLRAGDIVMRRLGPDLFLADLQARAVLHLNDTGRALWTLLADGASPSDAAAALALAYPDAGPDRVAADVARAFADMTAAGVIRPA